MNYTYVGIILVRSDAAVLVQHRDNLPTIPEPNKWGICGGRVELSDSSNVSAAARELLEETGYLANPEDLQYLGGDEFEAGNDHISRLFYFAPYDGVQEIHCYEGREMRFVLPANLPDLDFCETYHLKYLLQASERLRGVQQHERCRL